MENQFNVPSPKIDEVTLEQIKQRLSARFNSEFFMYSRPTAYNQIELMIERAFMGEQIHESHEIYFKKPATWWQHFKEANFLSWLLRRFPVKYQIEIKIVEFRRAFEFPKAYRPNHAPFNHYIIHDNPPLSYNPNEQPEL